ncbi:MAG: hypothetical protein ACRCZI_09125 [Cetobacterium sp.]
MNTNWPDSLGTGGRAAAAGGTTRTSTSDRTTERWYAVRMPNGQYVRRPVYFEPKYTTSVGGALWFANIDSALAVALEYRGRVVTITVDDVHA